MRIKMAPGRIGGIVTGGTVLADMAQDIEIIGVVGAGAMGRGIAQVSIAGGMMVRLFDAAPGAAAKAADAIAAAAHTVADTLQLAGIICYTATGSTALRVARERPGLSVIGLSPVVATGRKLALVWGVHCVLTSDPENQAAMVRKACRIAFDEGFAKAGEGVIIVAGVPLGSPGTTNMVRIAYLDDRGNPVAEGS